MMGIIDIIQLCILTVNSQCILGQIIGSDTEEINLFCKKITDHNSCRSLDHDTLLHVITERDPLFLKLCFYFCYNSLDLLHLSYRDDHRIHDGNISEHACAEKCSQLCLKYFRTVQTDTDRTISHCRVFLMRHIEIIDLLVRSDIQSTNDNFFAGHILSYGLVNLELLFLCRIVFFFQVYEFTSEKSDAFRIIGKYIRNITCTSDVGIKVELTTTLGNSFFTFQLFEHCTLCKFIGTHILIFF